ncbi:hypothetical protein TrCOL_g2775 [Triparma columacea]|uniref:Metallo-beta-lactamase domain-containing protein n=1 Tax=Triparma columacea TaxID=722753 RepID=A0A9W7LDT0_9STRA|nr:hypothetical protein TrCOL_g2775 [Triparma columacea]
MHSPLYKQLLIVTLLLIVPFLDSFHLPIRIKLPTSLDSQSEDTDSSSQLSRRQVGELTIASLGGLLTLQGTSTRTKSDYPLWGILPVGPYKRKKTIISTIVPDKIWTLDQKFGILNVQVPLRMTVVALSDGGLLIYNPLACTEELQDLLAPIIEQFGQPKHIVLGTVALEHKVYAGVFAQKYPKAIVYLQPGQYSSPLNLPDTFLGFPVGRTKPIPTDSSSCPWSKEFSTYQLGPFISRDGCYSECVLFHPSTKTLLVTDCVLEVDQKVPEIFNDDPAPLLYHARDKVTDVVEDSPETRLRGWRRVALFGLFFQPSSIVIEEADAAYAQRRPDINPDFLGVYPWTWVEPETKSFDAITNGLLVAPILQKLILSRYPIQTLDFADAISSLPIERIIPCHFGNDLKYSGADFRRAFSFLEEGGVKKGPRPRPEDFKQLEDAETSLLESGAIAPAPPMPGSMGVTREDIIKATEARCRKGICSQSAVST